MSEYRPSIGLLAAPKLAKCFGALVVMLFASCFHGASAGFEERAVWCSVDQ